MFMSRSRPESYKSQVFLVETEARQNAGAESIKDRGELLLHDFRFITLFRIKHCHCKL